MTAATIPALDAEDVAALADGALPADRRDAIAAALASSSAESKLAHVLRDLRADSDALATDIARTASGTTHRRHRHVERRTAAGRRFASAARWSAMAACLVAVVGVLALRHHTIEPTRMPAHAMTRADRIFTANDHIFSDVDSGSAAAGDELFRTDFSGG